MCLAPFFSMKSHLVLTARVKLELDRSLDKWVLIHLGNFVPRLNWIPLFLTQNRIVITKASLSGNVLMNFRTPGWKFCLATVKFLEAFEGLCSVETEHIFCTFNLSLNVWSQINKLEGLRSIWSILTDVTYLYLDENWILFRTQYHYCPQTARSQFQSLQP